MRRLSSNLYVESVNGNELVHCLCGSVLGPADTGNDDARHLLKVKDTDLSKAGPNVNPYALGAQRFFLREYYCPACSRLIETEVALKES
jgi:acetone carboxylase gamma subunit